MRNSDFSTVPNCKLQGTDIVIVFLLDIEDRVTLGI